MKTCFIFSGQGAQYSGMGKELYENFEICKEVFETANKSLGFSISDICFNEDERLNETEYTQPAILTTSYAIFRLLDEKNIKCDAMAGLSLGEYTALCAGGSLDFAKAVVLVKKRGRLMTEAVPKGVGGMTAVLNADINILRENLLKASTNDEKVMISNYNTTGQLVIAGHIKALERAENFLKEAGIKKLIRLNVSGPFHTSLLNEASEKLAIELDDIVINKPKVDIYTNVTANKIVDIVDIKETLIKQIKSPVKWEQTIRNLLEDGFDTFVEIGPNKVLSGFVKKIDRNVKILNVENMKTLEIALNELR